MDVARRDHKKTQINHVIINRRWRSSLQDVRAYRGADVASDHTLVLAVVSLKLHRSKGRQARQQRLDSGRLNESLTKQAFAVEVKNRFQVLGEQQEMTIDGFNQALREAGEKVLGFRRKKKEEWIKEETWKKIHERRQTKRRSTILDQNAWKSNTEVFILNWTNRWRGWQEPTRRTTSRNWQMRQRKQQVEMIKDAV